MVDRLRPLIAVSAAVVAAVLAAGALVVVAQAPASAAWTTVTRLHDAHLQICRTDGGQRIRFRLDNRRADHAHQGSVYRIRDSGGESLRTVRARRGALSGVVTMRVGRGDTLESSVGEIDGPSAGGGFSLTDLARC